MRRAAAVLAAALGLLPGAGSVAAAPAPPPWQSLSIGSTQVLVAVPEGEFSSPLLLNEWITRSARIVAGYYGGFPVPQLRILVRPVAGGRVEGGSTFGEPAPVIRLRVGRSVDAATLMNDWVLVHEMVHLALPDVGEAHAWLSEGLAVYIEGVARVQAGNRTLEDVFAEEQRSMPRGLPGASGTGLDQDHSWGRTYWGGALFCLLADVQIRQRTDNRQGLQDAMTAVLRESGGLVTHWDLRRVFATADAAVGVPVMSELYAQMGDKPVAPDLQALWRSLGVEFSAGAVQINDAAPLAAVRRAIFRRP